MIFFDSYDGYWMKNFSNLKLQFLLFFKYEKKNKKKQRSGVITRVVQNATKKKLDVFKLA